MAAYVPARGDLVWLQFNPQAGHEQAGHRPAVVISPSSYNRRVGPVTSQVKGYRLRSASPAGAWGRGSDPFRSAQEPGLARAKGEAHWERAR